MRVLNPVLRHVPVELDPWYPVNVEVPDDYVRLVDENLKPGALLSGRASKEEPRLFDMRFLSS